MHALAPLTSLRASFCGCGHRRPRDCDRVQRPHRATLVIFGNSRRYSRWRRAPGSGHLRAIHVSSERTKYIHRNAECSGGGARCNSTSIKSDTVERESTAASDCSERWGFLRSHPCLFWLYRRLIFRARHLFERYALKPSIRVRPIKLLTSAFGTHSAHAGAAATL